MKSSILALFFLLTFGTSSQASMLEFRVGGSYHTVNPSDFNEFLKDNLDEDNIDSVKAIVTLTGDGIFYLPMIPLGIGARVDWIGIPTQESDGTEFDFSLSRLALLVNYRVFDEFFYFGPIATLGLYHGLEMSVSGAEEVEGETYDYDFKIDDYKGASFSVGAEAGIKVAFFMVGGELGYEYWKYSDISFSGIDSDLEDDDFFTELDLSGMYLKILLGVNF